MIEKRQKVSLQSRLHREDVSLLKRYQQRVLSSERLLDLAYYETVTTFASWIPGALGFVIRKKIYGRLFNTCGRQVIIGCGVTLRHPDRIDIADRVAIDDYVLLDAQGTGPEGMKIGSEVIISRGCSIQGKTGSVVLKDRADIGANTIISSVAGVTIGEDALIAGHCYIGGARYNWQRTDIPMSQQGQHTKGPVVIEDDVWLGAGVTVLDGVKIGKGCIVAAGAVVTSDLPEYVIAAGVPCRVMKERSEPS